MITPTKRAIPSRTQGYHRRWTLVLVAGLLVFAVGAHLRPIPFSGWANSLSEDPQVSNRPFSWDDVEPSPALTWHDCYISRQCARLIVPRDHSDPQGATITIALARVVSSVPVDSPEYRGPVLINPGGPGGSGVDFVVNSGDAISKILGPQFDVVGFDPRGVGRSTPGVSFFDTPATRALAWGRAQIIGKLASDHIDQDALVHINTDSTARDMLRIVQAHGREKLQYWGFSYGSVLGLTFAALFPDKVARLVVDGVVDAENYYSTLWDNNLLDTDKTLQAFFDGCHQAGPKLCPFYAPTPEKISQNLDALYAAVTARPVPVYTQTAYGLIDYSRLRLTVFNSLYRPYQTFPSLARALADLASGDGTVLYQMLEGPRFQCSCGPPEPFVSVSSEAQIAILCGDGQVVPPDFESAESFYKKFSDTTPGWPNSPKTHFQGPLKANTSFPLLLIGNTADPVAPLWAAKKMSKGFPGSVVLAQDSPGHGSTSGPSTCTQKYVHDYFVDGTLPPVDKICPVVRTPFPKQVAQDGPDSSEDQMPFDSEVISAEDRELLDAIEQIHSSLPSAMTHLGNSMEGLLL
ncbi:Alpha/Beta hydrolase protein [Infundibulicybe gibba]|nr:Alpha/Beta hydrolase protein [Infundibulicybe gibba]